MSLIKTQSPDPIALNGFFLKEFEGHQIRTRQIDGYVNATDICKVKKGRLTKHYFENDSSQEFISEIYSHGGFPPCALVEKNKGGTYKGT